MPYLIGPCKFAGCGKKLHFYSFDGKPLADPEQGS